MRVQCYLIFLLLSFIEIACHPNNNTIQTLVTISSKDSEILTRKKESETSIAKLLTTMKLSPINNGVDSFELRLWVGSMFKEHDLYIVTYKSNVWKSHHFTYFTDENTGKTFYKEERIKTSFSTNELADSLRLIDFTGLQSQEEIQYSKDKSADGIYYYLEVATTGSYKQLNYHNPQLFAGTESNNRKFLSVITLLKKHFQTMVVLPIIKSS